MNLAEKVIKLAKGNFGALNALMTLSNPTYVLFNESIEAINQLDTLGIKGTDIYVLYSDICERNDTKTLELINATRNGKLDPAVLIDACSRQDYSGKEIIEREYWSKK